ncbi:MAG: hypothetical protein RLW61_09765 [Gammaproteobacteria bacterium]
MLGLAALPLIAVPHPLAGNDAALVIAKARGVAAEVAFALTAGVAVLGARYENRFHALTERRLTGGAVCVDDVCAVDQALDRVPGPGAGSDRGAGT